ncbi:MAG: hypothetical protein Q9195_002884 [Heterodermia aff. obscurata]
MLSPLQKLPWELLGGLIFSSIWLTDGVTAGPAVNVALQASFGSPPYMLELLETAAEENSSAYFPLLDRIAEGRFADCGTDAELYSNFLQVVREDGHITEHDALSSFQLALSIHSAAPRIEAHYQYYATSVESYLMIAQDAACPVWVHFEGKQYCSPALDRAQQDFESAQTSDALPFDRVLGPGTDGWPPASILYADITSPLFGTFHRTISQTARNGQTSYRIRYRPSLASARKPLVVNGYGVELALKRTDYIVIDDRESGTSAVEGNAPVMDAGQVVLEAEELADLKPLSSTELLGLGLKTATFIMSSENPFDTLIKVSQDFPKHSSAITKRNVSTELVAEHNRNREHLLPAGYNVVWMNGLQVEARQMDIFALLEQMRRERSLVKNLREIGFSGSEAVSLLSHPAVAEAKVQGEAQRYDYRDTLEGSNVIIWLNDIEKDKRYEGWPSHSSALLQRTYPGQLPSVRRDIHNVVIPMDLTDIKDVELLVESIQMFVKRKSTEAKQVSVANKAAFESTIKDRKLRNDRQIIDFRYILDSDDSQSRLLSTQSYLKRLGADGPSPPFLVNGVVLPRNEGWLQSMSSRVDVDLRQIQRQVYEDAIAEDAWLAGQFIESAVTHRNALIIPEDESSIKIVDIASMVNTHSDIWQRLPRIMTNESTRTELPALLLVVADVDTPQGAKLITESVDFVREQKPFADVELRVLHNPGSDSSIPISVVLHQYMQNSGYEIGFDKLETILNVDRAVRKAQTRETLDYPPEIIAMSQAFWDFTQPFAQSIGLQPGEAGMLLSGRFVGPVPKDASFTSDEFKQLLQFERSKRLDPAGSALGALGFEDRVKTPLNSAVLSSLIALSTVSDIPEGIFESAPGLRMSQFDDWASDHTVISTGDPDTASIHFVASIDPTSEIAQRWIPLLKVLSDLDGVYVKIFLNPKERMQELPIKRFYRHVLDAKPTFNEDGDLRILQATFEGLPKEALLNLALDVPPAWLVASKESVHDLDNIKLSTIKDDATIDALYELEHILIEGHSRDVTTGPPPRGVQLLLGTAKDPHFADTIIMANLGYFQFKANPGYWSLSLQPGRSTQIFTIDSAGQKGYSPQPGDSSTDIALLSFQGKTLYPRLSRKPGQENEDVLEETAKPSAAKTYLSKATKYASSMLSNVGLTPAKSDEAQADINIFSVASGHLYERMLNIMMLSVMRHTSHTVKFWFIEQFLSPSFKRSLPHLAKNYNFQYALVTYKWPHWLRAQKEKQREIWGYKILFLDVLFPLNLDKVIFVDADQIVRTDMYELVQHDLQGAPYGFTPMCDSRTEMEGFRFWKQGYWSNYLRGLPYHISALYVVDLHHFRAIAAGDRLRQQYHQLSADPASLSNLDQDLPNHMQHQLPIHSLPQEWLWCETWCSDESLAKARTIDLCNNPQTKEPKLDRARRQVPEWTAYDDEIAEVLMKAKENGEMGSEGFETGAEVADEKLGKGVQDQTEWKNAAGEGEKEQRKIRNEL